VAKIGLSLIFTGAKEPAGVWRSTTKDVMVFLKAHLGYSGELWAWSVCGQLINLLCIEYKEDHKKVISELRRSGIPITLSSLFKRRLHNEGLFP